MHDGFYLSLPMFAVNRQFPVFCILPDSLLLRRRFYPSAFLLHPQRTADKSLFSA